MPTDENICCTVARGNDTVCSRHDDGSIVTRRLYRYRTIVIVTLFIAKMRTVVITLQHYDPGEGDKRDAAVRWVAAPRPPTE